MTCYIAVEHSLELLCFKFRGPCSFGRNVVSCVVPCFMVYIAEYMIVVFSFDCA